MTSNTAEMRSDKAVDEAKKQISDIVAGHYNNLDEKGLSERARSRIFYLRNFNNWIKSMLIGEYLQKIKHKCAQLHKETTVLDLCCGKGGDLLKWKIGEIDYLVCADIASTSVQQCNRRYEEMLQRRHSERRPRNLFKAEFITADCTRDRLKDLYKKKDIQFDLVSCQFSFHYCFESLTQVDCMLKNISECLLPGGYFIGSTPDACQIVNNLKKSDGLSFGNSIYSITFPSKTDFPLFGAKYDFHLERVVDCPEFLVYFPLLEKLAGNHGLKLIFCERFDNFYYSAMEKDKEQGYQYDGARQLLERMQALETYSSFDSANLSSSDEKDYEHAKKEVQNLEKESGRNERVGTLSSSEWEVIALYVVFAFEKQHSRIADNTSDKKRKRDEDEEFSKKGERDEDEEFSKKGERDEDEEFSKKGERDEDEEFSKKRKRDEDDKSSKKQKLEVSL